MPGRLLVLRERWSLDIESVLPKGSMSVVLRCRTAQGERAMLKICPDRERVATEIAGLARWSTPHIPTVLRADPSMGALLIEEIVPGTPLLHVRVFSLFGTSDLWRVPADWVGRPFREVIKALRRGEDRALPPSSG